MKKRILSMALVLCMCLSLLPTAAFAEGEPQEITTVDLTGFTAPVYGATPDFELSVRLRARAPQIWGMRRKRAR